jgi:hypothetical protein
MKLTNTLKHLQVGCVAAVIIVVLEWAIGLAFSDYSGGIAGFAAVVWGLLTLNYERNQFMAATEPSKKLMSWKQYLKLKWLDTIVDLIAGNAPVWLMLAAAGLL